MFTVALIGPDGSGKSTVSKYLIENFPAPLERIYMGINRKESNYILPTTRFILFMRRLLKRETNQGGPRSTPAAPMPKNLIKRVLREIKLSILLVDRITEAWYRQFITWQFVRRGRIVVYDRHFYADFHENASSLDTHWTSKLHSYMLNNLYPKPDVLIYLDAPAEVLFARKGEGTIELLEARRQVYLSLKNVVPHFEIVDASQPIETVYACVEDIIYNFMKEYKNHESS